MPCLLKISLLPIPSNRFETILRGKSISTHLKVRVSAETGMPLRSVSIDLSDLGE